MCILRMSKSLRNISNANVCSGDSLGSSWLASCSSGLFAFASTGVERERCAGLAAGHGSLLKLSWLTLALPAGVRFG